MIPVRTLLAAVAAERELSPLTLLGDAPAAAEVAEARAFTAWVAFVHSGLDTATIGRVLGRSSGAVVREIADVDLRRAADAAYREETDALERTVVRAVGALVRRLGAPPQEDFDPIAVARFALAHPRNACALSVEETRALAAAVLAGAGEGTQPTEQEVGRG